MLASLSLVLLVIKVIATELNPPQGYVMFFNNLRSPFHYAIASILIGVVVAMLAQQRTPRHLPFFALASLFFTGITLTFSNFYNTQNWQSAHILHYFVVICLGVMVWAAVKKTGTRHLRFLNGRLLRIVSKLSYALYLTHYAVLPWVNKLHRQVIHSEEAWIHAGAFFLIYLSFSVVFSVALHYLVEKPFLILKSIKQR